MPAMHLIRVDLPAPLSPTSAITSPALTEKSTSVRACTEPNDLVIPRTSSSGLSFTVAVFLTQNLWRRPRGRLHLDSRALYLQNCANSPTQTSLFFRKLSLKSRV